MPRPKNRTDLHTVDGDAGLPANVDLLSDAVRNLTEHVQLLGNTVDQLASAIQWGLQNDKFRSPQNPTIAPAQIDYDQIDAIVRQACSELTAKLTAAIRDTRADTT
jgi:hypothetical protein